MGWIKHRMSKTPEYRAWSNMLDRCYRVAHPQYEEYGGRGISVCSRWRNSFENFFSDIGVRPSTKHSLDRCENNGNYEPSNCRWATSIEQNNNTRGNHFIVFNGQKMSVLQAIKIAKPKVQFPAVYKRLARGWSVEEALQ